MAERIRTIEIRRSMGVSFGRKPHKYSAVLVGISTSRLRLLPVHRTRLEHYTAEFSFDLGEAVDNGIQTERRSEYLKFALELKQESERLTDQPLRHGAKPFSLT
jgi:hypothetical protein